MLSQIYAHSGNKSTAADGCAAEENTSTHNTLSTGHCHRTLYNYSNIWCICFCFNMLWVTVLLSSGNGSDSIDRLLWDTSVSSTPAITSHRASAEAVDDSDSLRVLIELLVSGTAGRWCPHVVSGNQKSFPVDPDRRPCSKEQVYSLLLLAGRRDTSLSRQMISLWGSS